MAFCGSFKIRDGVRWLAGIEVLAAMFFFFCLRVISTKEFFVKLDSRVIESLTFFLIVLGSIFNGLLQLTLFHFSLEKYADANTFVKMCRAWLPLRLIALAITYSPLCYLVRGLEEAEQGQVLMIVLVIPFVVFIFAWCTVLAYILQFPVRRQIERPEPPRPPLVVLNVGAPNPQPILPAATASSTLDNISSAADNNKNIFSVFPDFQPDFEFKFSFRMSTFGDLSSKKGLEKLNEHLKTRSYIQSYQATQLDGSTYGQLKSAPSAKDYPHLSRWYNHIKSLGSTVGQLPTAGDQNGRVPKPADDDDDVDLFPSDGEEDEDAAKIREQRLQEYADKKSKKGAGPVAKSSVILDVKPWDDETNMKGVETSVRSIIMDGLVWGASKLVPVAYGINKLQIICVVEDEKVSIEALTEKIQNFEDFVQYVDVAAFNKV